MRATINKLRGAKAQLSAAEAEFRAEVEARLEQMLPPGSVVEAFSHEFGHLRVMHGNGRGARQFRIAGPAVVVDVCPAHPHLTRWEAPAQPLNDAGKPMSGRAGNQKSYGKAPSDLLTIRGGCGSEAGPDDPRSSDQIFLQFFHDEPTT